MEQSLFFGIFNFFNGTQVGSLLAIFFASWLPIVLIAFLFFHEWSTQKGTGLNSSMKRSMASLFPAIAAFTLSEFFKFIAPSPRPFLALDITPLITVSDAMGSFPSTHATFFFALALTLCLGKHKFWPWYVAGAVFVAIGRIAVGVHFPLDIFAGILLGTTMGFAVFHVLKFFKKK